MSEEQQIDSKEETVRAFLKENPGFLDDNPDILEMLELPHNTGSAVCIQFKLVVQVKIAALSRLFFDTKDIILKVTGHFFCIELPQT